MHYFCCSWGGIVTITFALMVGKGGQQMGRWNGVIMGLPIYNILTGAL